MGTGQQPRPLIIETSDGERLEATIDAVTQPHSVAIIAHPHPQFGGDMHNPVVAALRTGFQSAGCTSVRFNFRGVGRSTGTHGGGPSEVLDLNAAFRWTREAYPGVPVLLAGYSFGADVVLASDLEGPEAEILVAAPLSIFASEELARQDRKRLFVVPEHDQFSTPERTVEQTASWQNASVSILSMADHFLAGVLDRVSEHAAEFARTM